MSLPTLDIVINNYQYGRYLGEAIESALRQTRPPARVVVVDDGSADNSREVIREFGARVVPVFQDNRGQASAINAGFAQVRGELVLFLDADDVLEPTTVERLARAFAMAPTAARAHYRMRVIDGAGNLTGAIKPSPHLDLPQGDLVRATLANPFDAAWLPTSGNAFRASVLRRLCPIPEGPYRVCADWYLVNLAPLYGPVIAVDEPLARYRIHGANNYEPAVARLDTTHLRETIVYAAETRGHITRHATLLGIPTNGEPASMSDVANRLVSLRIDRLRHPVAGDNVRRLVHLGLRAARYRRHAQPGLAVLYMVWLLAATVAPQPLLRPLAELFMFPARRRGTVNRVFVRMGAMDGR